jgi:hypothetical protein
VVWGQKPENPHLMEISLIIRDGREEMKFDADELRTLFSGIAIVVSLLSLWFSYRSWLRSNRPIVVAAIEAFRGGNLAIALNLVVMNVGNRPALRVRLNAKKSDIVNCLYDSADHSFEETIYRCFSDQAEIPLLLDGKNAINSFGFLSINKGTSSWIDKSVLPIEMTYFDLDGRKYKSKLKLVIKGEKGFAGGAWSERNNS